MNVSGKYLKNNATVIAWSYFIDIMAILCLTIGNGVWCMVSGFALLLISLEITTKCLYRNHSGPFEITSFGITLIILIVFLLFKIFNVTSYDVKTMLENTFLPSWDWVAIIFAMASLIFAACTWVSQEHTQKNTMRITPEIQYGIIKDLFRHTYRNIMVVYALEELIKGRLKDYYPSQEHIFKLRTNEDALYPEAFVENPENCGIVQNLKFEIRNGNIELDVMSTHMRDRDLNPQVKERDFRLLKSRIEYSIRRIAEVTRKIYDKDSSDFARDILDYVSQNAANRNDITHKKLIKEIGEKLDSGELAYLYTEYGSSLVKELFPDGNKEEIRMFIRKLNQNIYLQLFLPDKICIIPFDAKEDIVNVM